jgi:hypothetical protein
LPVVYGLSTEKREVLNTSLMEGSPEHRYELPEDSIWPFVLGLVVSGTLVGVIFNPWAIPIGALLTYIVLILWFWRGNEPKSLMSHEEAPPQGVLALKPKARTA